MVIKKKRKSASYAAERQNQNVLQEADVIKKRKRRRISNINYMQDKVSPRKLKLE